MSFNATLLDFQLKHEENLLKKCADNEEIVLSAPTGSGKTVLVCKFIEDYLDENPHTVFLWLCPGAGGLEKQSQETFQEMVSGIEDGNVYDFISEPNPEGHVYFINWDKINKKSNIVLKEGEHKDLMSKIYACHNSNIDIFVIIDEEHKYKATAAEYVAIIQPKHVLRVSATPVSRGNHTEIITDDEVIASGLIAQGISINEGLAAAVEENNNLDDDLLLLKLADEKRKEIQNTYDKRGIPIRPLVLVQFPNGWPEKIARVKSELENLGYTEKNGLVASWFSGAHPDKPEEIKKLDGQYAFLLFKQAIATGWDCPRAKILVKLREGGTEQFNIQTIGRIRRMPQRQHYDDALLDNCYLYTLDNQFKQGLTNSLLDSFYVYQYRKKQQAPNILLEKETLEGSDLYAVNPKAVVDVVRKQMLQRYDLNKDGHLDKREMERAQGYVFGTVLKTEAFEGVARTTHDMLSLNKIFAGEHEINNHDDGMLVRHAKRQIAQAIGIDESISSNALRVLFGPEDMSFSLLSQEEKEYEHAHKLIQGMKLREYNAFLINNREKLVEVFSQISQEQIADLEQPAALVKKNWGIPAYQYYKQHKSVESTRILTKNVFDKYGNNILIPPNRTHTEIVFETWCEDYKPVQWVYKNGDKGDDFFTIVFKKAFRRNNFYPDYIIQLQNKDIWIIEAKGGMNAEGESANIDKYAKNKFEALKDYATRHSNIHWGFVRAIGNQLYLSNTEWDENVTNRNVWKPIEVFIQ